MRKSECASELNDLCACGSGVSSASAGQIFGDMFDSASWPFANLLTLSERISPQAPLGMLHEAGGLAVKMQVSGQRRHQHVSGCTFDLVPPAGFEPARAAPESVAVYVPDQRKRARRRPTRAHI